MKHASIPFRDNSTNNMRKKTLCNFLPVTFSQGFSSESTFCSVLGN